MKFSTAAVQILLAPLVLAAPSKFEKKVTYDGYKVFRIATHHDAAIIKEQLASLKAVNINLNDAEHLDVAVP